MQRHFAVDGQSLASTPVCAASRQALRHRQALTPVCASVALTPVTARKFRHPARYQRLYGAYNFALGSKRNPTNTSQQMWCLRTARRPESVGFRRHSADGRAGSDQQYALRVRLNRCCGILISVVLDHVTCSYVEFNDQSHKYVATPSMIGD